MTERNNNRMVLLLIAGIPLTMVLAATWLWYFVVQGDLDLVGALGTANQGSLVQPPRQIDESQLYDGSVPSPYSELEPRWTLAVPWGAKSCDQQCEHTLYETRQIHVAMGKNFNRLRRIFVSESGVDETQLAVTQLSDERPAPASFAEFLEAEHRGLKAYRLEEGGYERLFAEWSQDRSTWYLMDPRGWVMMSYNSSISYKDVISDLKFLLKNSSD